MLIDGTKAIQTSEVKQVDIHTLYDVCIKINAHKICEYQRWTKKENKLYWPRKWNTAEARWYLKRKNYWIFFFYFLSKLIFPTIMLQPYFLRHIWHKRGTVCYMKWNACWIWFANNFSRVLTRQRVCC